MKKFKDVMYHIFEFIIGIVVLLAMVYIIFCIGKGVVSFLKWVSKPNSQSNCYFKYVDVNGVEGTGTSCKRTWDNVYCGNDNDAHLVVSFERVCE